MRLTFSLLLLLLLVSRCSQKTVLSSHEYMDFMSSGKNGLKMTRELNGIVYGLQMLTPEQQALNASPEALENNALLKEELGYYKDKLNFILILQDAANSNNIVKSTLFDKAAMAKYWLTRIHH